MYGDLLYDYVFFYGGFVVVGVIISENLALFVIKKFKSLLMYPVIYLFVCLVGLVLALYVNIGKWITDNSHGVDVWKFNSYC